MFLNFLESICFLNLSAPLLLFMDLEPGGKNEKFVESHAMISYDDCML